MTTKPALIKAARKLQKEVNALNFSGNVAYVYNPLDYAWQIHEQYLTRFGSGKKRVVMLGMNPGPFGMMQTGVPFGEVAAVKDWMQLDGQVDQPDNWHPKRPIQGLQCERSEVSGRRLWGWAADQFGTADKFFAQTFVLNYCPLVFLEAGGRNLTPDKLPAAELAPLQQACDTHLKAALKALDPEWAIGVGAYAAKRLQSITGAPIQTGKPEKPGKKKPVKPSAGALNVGQILHPSPASPAANRGWAEAAQATLDKLKIYNGPHGR